MPSHLISLVSCSVDFDPEDGGDTFLRNVRSYIPEDGNIHFHNYRCENLKSYKIMSVYIYKELYGNEGPE
jgi:hypothetical protein